MLLVLLFTVIKIVLPQFILPRVAPVGRILFMYSRINNQSINQSINKRGPSTNVSYFHYRSGLVSCCFVDRTCNQPVNAASSLQELAAMRNLTTCELDKRRHLVTDVRTSKRHMASSTCLATRCRSYLTHIPYIPKSFGSHLFCVNIRALLSASIACCQIRMTGH